MADFRIQQTKQKLRTALLALLRDTPFERISVTDLCRRSGVSRITFYAYYNDKTELAGELFEEMLNDAVAIFSRLQAEKNSGDDPRLSCRNLLQAILQMEADNRKFLCRISQEGNAYLAFCYYRCVMRGAFEHSKKYLEQLQPAFPVEMTVSFLCTGLWGFLRTGNLAGNPEDSLRDMADRLLDILLCGDLFTGADRA